MARRAAFDIAGEKIQAGTARTVNVPLPNQSTYTPMAMPVHVIHGKKDGPVLFICAAIHGDEINGVEIIRELIRMRRFKSLSGTLLLIPIVNLYGFINHSRYLPDGRDLNRSFPGSEHGSLAARLAHRFSKEILDRCTHGIDLHTAGGHRINHPHIRADLEDAETKVMAEAFGTPVMINANLRDGSLRQVAADKGVKTLLYEAGSALRFEPFPVKVGLRGIVKTMRQLSMLPKLKKTSHEKVIAARSSSWVRAPQSGILSIDIPLGARIEEGQPLGRISNALGHSPHKLLSPFEGIVIGRTNLPVINEGDALFHVARFHDALQVEAAVEAFHERHIEGLGPGDYSGGPTETPL